MKLFECGQCRQLVHFDNFACIACGSRLGFFPETLAMLALSMEGEAWRAAKDEGIYRSCANTQYDACNWLLPAESKDSLCLACRHNHVIPDLSAEDHAARWRKLEAAKRHLFYSLLRWGLTDPDPAKSLSSGLSFNFMSDPPDASEEPILTGHADGVITINLAEADDAERELRRTEMKETYRTVLGHFRHEIGHYFWDRLVRDGDRIEAFRALFGDESADYQAALKTHYDSGPPADWANRFISAYASTHPWEDFAESWAHYMHIVDALETAHYLGLKLQPRIEPELDAAIVYNPYLAGRLDDLISDWVSVTVAINGINRSMGQPDLYPFVLSKAAIEKLAFVHGLIANARDREGTLKSKAR